MVTKWLCAAMAARRSHTIGPTAALDLAHIQTHWVDGSNFVVPSVIPA